MGEKLHEYQGEKARVTFDAKRCIHAAECVHGLPGVFDPEARPWINPDGAEPQELAEVVSRCPTGALQMTQTDGTVAEAGAEEVSTENVVTIDPDGPLFARGDILVVDSEGNEVLRDTRIAFCRCGASENKPFCDGKHSDAKFEDPAGIPDPKLGGDNADSGTLKVVLAKNGPLVLNGPLTLRGVSDECSGGRGALCRCGASANKPFCDGAHSKIGFSAT